MTESIEMEERQSVVIRHATVRLRFFPGGVFGESEDVFSQKVEKTRVWTSPILSFKVHRNLLCVNNCHSTTFDEIL